MRGGGSRTDLAAFDGRELAAEIAASPLPVLTGLGHEIDRAIADEVAHTASTTPTAVAELLTQRVAGAEQRCVRLAGLLSRRAEAAVGSSYAHLDRLHQGLRLAALPLERMRHRLKELESGLVRAGTERVGRLEQRVERLSAALGEPSLDRLARAGAHCDRLGTEVERLGLRSLAAGEQRLAGFERLFAQLDPRRTLERGFSITRDADGRAVRRSDAVAGGDRLTTELAVGRITSRVEET